MRRFLTVSALLVVLATALVVAAAYFLIFTQSGLRFIVAHLPEHFGTARVRIEQVSGTLVEGVHVRQVVIDQRHVYMRLDDIATRVRFSAFSLRTLVSRDTTIGRAYVRIKHAAPLPVAHPKFLPWWLDVRIDHAHIGSLALELADGRRLSGEDIDGAAQINSQDIRIPRLTLRMGHTSYALAGALHAARPMQLSAAGRFTWQAPHEPRWAGRGALHGNVGKLNVSLRLHAPFAATLQGVLRDHRGRWVAHSELRLHGLDLRTWHRTDMFGQISARLALNGGTEGFTLEGTVNPAGLRAGAFHVALDGKVAGGVLHARGISIRHLTTGTVLSASGTVRLRSGRPELHLDGAWHALRWPLVGAALVHSASGQFSLAGRLPYAIHAQGLAGIRSWPEVPVTFNGTLQSTGLRIEPSTVRLLGGQVQARGSLSWLPVKHWSLHVRGRGINPGSVRPILRGRIGFAFSASGQRFNLEGPLSIRIERLSGQVRGQSASGGGEVARAQGAWTFRRLRIRLGGTHLALDGRIDHEADLRFALAGDLRLISTADRGHINLTGSLHGPLAAPQVRAALWGTGLHVGPNSLASIRADVDFDPTSRRTSHVTVQLHQLRSRHHLLRTLAFTLTGPASNLHAHLQVHAPGLNIAARAGGSFAAGVFNGQITAFNVSGVQSLRLRLRQPATLSFSRMRSALTTLCLKGSPGALCTGVNWTPAHWSAYVSATGLPLATLTAGMTPSVEYQGTLGAQIDINGGDGMPTQGTLRMSLAQAVLSRRLVSGQIEHTSIGSGLLTVTAQRRVIHAQASLKSGAIGTLDAKLDIGRRVADWRDMPLKGTVHVRTGKLNLVSLYMPGVDAVSGVLVANASVGGTVAAPHLHGLVRVVDGAADLYRTNLQMRHISLTAQLANGGLTFDGLAQVGKGELHAKGQMGWRDAVPYGDLHLQGHDLRVVNVPEAQIDAAPNLDFRMAAHRIDVTGTVVISHARITPRNFSGAVRTSSDQVIVGAESPNAQHRYQVVSAITFELGNDVHIDTMGLTANLSGRITVRSKSGQGTTATGELFVRKGHYSAYARTLTIQTGRLFFHGGPLDNPGIEIRAVRRYPDVTAGINVSGTLKQPQVSFFSTPSLSQSQIMSLILSGGGGSLQSLQTSTAQTQKNTAANELLAQGGAIIAQQLGSRIGLPDVSLQTDLNNETSLVLGKYLSPRLYVSYGVGLTEQLSAIRLRYTIGENWTIRIEAGQGKLAGQSKSGELGGVDLVFSVTK